MKKKNNTALYLSLTILALIWLVPIVTVFITSLKSNSDFFSGMGLFDLPEKLQWHNYSDAWSKGHLDRYIRNGLIVTCLKVPISVFISSLLAFALTRLHVRHARGIFIFVLIGMMLPQQAALIPLNIVYSRAGLTNTYYCLILTYLGFGIPLATLVFRGFFRSIPKELDDAARNRRLHELPSVLEHHHAAGQARDRLCRHHGLPVHLERVHAAERPHHDRHHENRAERPSELLRRVYR